MFEKHDLFLLIIWICCIREFSFEKTNSGICDDDMSGR